MKNHIGVIFIVHQSVHTFHSKKASIRVRTDYLNFVTPFPAVFFCEKREIEGKVDLMLQELNFTLTTNNSIVEIINFVRSATFVRPGAIQQKMRVCNDIAIDFCRFTMAYAEHLQVFAKFIRAKCEEMFTSCTFNGRKFDCCHNFLPVDTFEGTCYALNSFNAIIDHQQHSRVHVRRNFKSAHFEESSIKALLHDYLPYKLVQDRKLNPANLSVEVEHPHLYVWYMGNTNLPTKMYQKENQHDLMGPKEDQVLTSTDVYLRVQEVIPDRSVTALREERRNCRFWHENRTLNAFKIYSNSACEIECLRKAQLANCKCVVHLLPNQNGLKDPLCNSTGMGCVADNTEIMEYLSKHCRCISNCHLLEVFVIGRVHYDNNVRFRSHRSTKRVNFMVRAPTVQFVRYAAQGSLDFIVSIGGAITLFIGCSFLSLAQIFYYFLLKPCSDCYIAHKRFRIRST